MAFYSEFTRIEGSIWEGSTRHWHITLPTFSMRRFKRAIDVAGSIAGIVLFGPLMLAIYVYLIMDGGKPIFAHRRLGKGGHDFHCYKFRSMVLDADVVLSRHLATNPAARAEWERRHKLEADPRVTRFGDFLRRKSLDELPQLLNVLKGDMSLVGPRPITRAEVKHYASDIFRYCQCRPGMTGLWQVSGRNDVSFYERVRMDERYVSEHNVWLDLTIIFRTVGVVMTGRGAS